MSVADVWTFGSSMIDRGRFTLLRKACERLGSACSDCHAALATCIALRAAAAGTSWDGVRDRQQSHLEQSFSLNRGCVTDDFCRVS